MFDLKCKRQGCKFNENCNCKANNISVGRGTECQTYEDCGYEKNQPDKIRQSPTRKDVDVGCKANCLFNDHQKCIANGISVMTNDRQPQCCTFMPK